MLRGFTTLNHYVDDLPAAVAWYAEVLGIEPYFAVPSTQDPAYVEFRIGDYQHELGLIDSRHRPEGVAAAAPAGAVMNWHVDDVDDAYERLLALGATAHEEPRDLGAPGWRIATVVDPFGNLVGVMHSPHYLEVLGR